jgi:hypothetical protein
MSSRLSYRKKRETKITLSRRDILASGVALAVACKSSFAWPAPTTNQQPQRTRLEDFAHDSKRVAALRRGVQVMKSRQPSDPRSWFFQAAIHGVRSQWIDEAKNQDPKVANVDQQRFWNQCPHHGQPAANFLLWHRAYLYYFERILRDAAQDDSLCVPYWNYTDPTQRGFPELFATPDYDPVSLKPRDPLFDSRREAAFMYHEYELTDDAVVVPDTTKFFGLHDNEGFAGGNSDQNPDTKGELETSPHDQIHFAVGGSIGFGTSAEPPSAEAAVGGLMSAVETAAFDPIFWVHHCNIDRLWSVWDCLPNRVWGTPPPKTWFQEKPWWFYDVDGQPKNLERERYLSPAKLGIAFDTDMPDCHPLSGTSPYPILVSNSLAPAPVTVAEQRHDVAGSTGPTNLSATAPVSKSISFPSPVKNEFAPAATYARQVFLEFNAVSKNATPSVRYDVFVNLREGAAPSRADPSYVGTLALFGLGEHPEEQQKVQFDITKQVSSPDFNPKTLKVTIVPAALLKPLQGAAELRRDGGVSIGGMKIVVVEGQLLNKGPQQQ